LFVFLLVIISISAGQRQFILRWLSKEQIDESKRYFSLVLDLYSGNVKNGDEHGMLMGEIVSCFGKLDKVIGSFIEIFRTEESKVDIAGMFGNCTSNYLRGKINRANDPSFSIESCLTAVGGFIPLIGEKSLS
ncbi:hypothetical protein PFISCL1PPCAC_26098, partial [Pristionchus fissidentatus]